MYVTKLEDELQRFAFVDGDQTGDSDQAFLDQAMYIYKFGLTEIYPNRFTSSFHNASQCCFSSLSRQDLYEVYHGGQTIAQLSVIAIERHTACKLHYNRVAICRVHTMPSNVCILIVQM